MDNQNLKAFITVAELGSFSEAADRLYLTQSAISKRIAQLEQQIGKKLFDRIARQVSLTEAGSELLPRAQRILQEYDSALQAINDLSGEASGTLRLAISHHLGLHRLPPVLKQFAQQYPNVTLDIEFMELAQLKTPQLKDLAEYPIILPGLNTYTGRIIQNLFQQEDIPLKAPMSTNYLETISTMVEIGLGWSVLPETLVRELHVMPFEQVSIERELGYIHHMKRSLSNAALAFLGLMDRA